MYRGRRGASGIKSVDRKDGCARVRDDERVEDVKEEKDDIVLGV